LAENTEIIHNNVLVRHIGDMAIWLSTFVGLPPDDGCLLPSLPLVETGLPIHICGNLKIQHKKIEEVAGKIKDNNTPDQSDYKMLHKEFQAYIAALLDAEEERKKIVETELMLLSRDEVMSELRREMSRLERNHTVFCLASLCVDQTDEWQNTEVQRILNKKIHKLLRDFDDCYNLGNTEAILCLKDTDLLDAKNILLRLCKQIDEADFGGKGITVSCGVTEPVEGDRVETLIKGIEFERNEARKAGGNAVFEYVEKAPLSKLSKGDNPIQSN